MTIEILRTIFNRDLGKLKLEIESYENEESLWSTAPGIANSGGNLCMHLIGNLNTYIGAALGGTNYVRDRNLEFSAKDVPRSVLIEKIAETTTVIDAALKNLTPDQLQSEYPLLVLEAKTSTEYFLIHLATHLSYHLGQINYHRRLRL